MPRQHTEETRQKIGEGVRKAAKVRRVQKSDMAKKMGKAADSFAQGHPDGVTPAKVRNYGDFGVDVGEVASEADHAPAHLPRRREYDPKRIEEFKQRREGERGGVVKPSVGGE